MRRLVSALLPLLLAVALGACEEEVESTGPAPIRSIKTYTISDVAGGQSLRYSGKIEAADTSSLSFAVSGTVAEIAVKAGDRVAEGQVLARLDRKPLQLDVEAAQAELSKARSVFREKDQDFQRKKALFQKGWIARGALEQVQAAMETARSDVGYATSKLNKARQALDDTVLRAPFDGVIGTRSGEPFTEVGAGQQILTLNAEAALEMAFAVPERAVGRLHIGMPADIEVSLPDKRQLPGRLTEIAAEGGTGNLFAVRASLERFPAGLRAGMSAEVLLTVGRQAGATGFLVPLAAIAPGDDRAEGYVFVFQPKSGTLSRRPITPRGVQDNLIAVEGLEAGQQVASAGVTFLRDGQKVKPMTGPLR